MGCWTPVLSHLSKVKTSFSLLPGAASGGLRASFEAHEKRVSPAARHELIGGIAVMQESDCAAAEALLASRPGIHTVLATTSDVQGEYRTREFEVLAGTPTTRTMVLEYGHRFTVDLSEAYFSPTACHGAPAGAPPDGGT